MGGDSKGGRSEAVRPVRRILHQSKQETWMVCTRLKLGERGIIDLFWLYPAGFVEVLGVTELNTTPRFLALDGVGIDQHGEDCGRGRFGGEGGEVGFGSVKTKASSQVLSGQSDSQAQGSGGGQPGDKNADMVRT